MLIDANYYKVKYGLHYENTVLFVVVGIRNDGYCEIFGVRLVETEDSLFWKDLFDDLKEEVYEVLS